MMGSVIYPNIKCQRKSFKDSQSSVEFAEGFLGMCGVLTTSNLKIHLYFQFALNVYHEKWEKMG